MDEELRLALIEDARARVLNGSRVYWESKIREIEEAQGYADGCYERMRLEAEEVNAFFDAQVFEGVMNPALSDPLLKSTARISGNHDREDLGRL